MENGLRTYLESRYSGTFVDRTPQPMMKKGILRKVMDAIRPQSVVVKTFSNLREISEEENRRLGSRLVDNFMIKDLSHNPSRNEVLETVSSHLSSQGYKHIGFVGNGDLYEDSQRNRVSLDVYTGTGYLAVKLVRV